MQAPFRFGFRSQHGHIVLTVVVIDDNERFRLSLIQHLTDSGLFEVVGRAGTGVEAITLAGQAQHDLLVMDVAMPVMDGITASEKITALHSSIAIILISSLSPDEMPDTVWRCGALGCVAKDNVSAGLIAQLYWQGPSDHRPGRR